MSTLGVDIGGANLKFSDGKQRHLSIPFELWRAPERLASEIRKALLTFPTCRLLSVTMTGELCDCFESRQAGVAAIVAAVAEAIGPGFPVCFYQVTGQFVNADAAVRHWNLTAAANWHAIAALAAKQFPGECGMLVDIGSTTTDLIHFAAGQVQAKGQSDWERIKAGELVYCGASRTPLCAVLPEFEWEGRSFGLAAEWFASVEDAFLYSGLIPERAEDRETCDGRGKTKELAARRLARQLCSEPEELGAELILGLADRSCEHVLTRLGQAMNHQLNSCRGKCDWDRVILSGSGEWLGRELLKHLGWTGPVTAWSELYSAAASETAAAFAVANLSGVTFLK